MEALIAVASCGTQLHTPGHAKHEGVSVTLRPGSLSGPRRPSLEILANSTHLTDVDSLAGLARFCSCSCCVGSSL